METNFRAMACVQMTPTIIYLVVACAVILFGTFSLIEDNTVSNHPCGMAYHLWKIALGNVIIWLFGATSCAAQGETARARAIVLIIFYSALSVWGMLLSQHLTLACGVVFDEQFPVVYWVVRICTVLDAIVAILFLVHELFLGRWCGSDLTNIPEIRHRNHFDIETLSHHLSHEGIVKYTGKYDPPRHMEEGSKCNRALNSPASLQPGQDMLEPQLQVKIEAIGRLESPREPPPTLLSSDLTLEYVKILSSSPEKESKPPPKTIA